MEGLRDKEEKIKRDLADGIRAVESNVTVNDVFALWKKNKIGIKEHTLVNYGYMYNRFVSDTIGKMKIKDVRKSDIRGFYNDILRNDKMAINTLDTINNVLHQVFATAVDDEYIRANPVDGVYTSIKAAYHYERPKRRALTLQQEKAFLTYIKNTPKYRHWLPIFVFLLGTGCRISEAVGLCWRNINFEKGIISICHNLVYHQHDAGKCYFTLTTTKTKAGTRTLPLINEVQNALLQEREHQNELGLTCQYKIDDLDDFVFLNRFGLPQNPQTVNKAIARIVRDYNVQELARAEKEKCEAQLLPSFSCHSLRHTYCTRLCEVETNIKLIQDLMGHSDVQTTMNIYAEVTQQTKAEAGVRLSGNLGISV